MNIILKKHGYLILGILTLLLFVAFYTTQDQIKFANGQGFDGRHYYQVSEQFRNNESIEAAAPFVYRLAVPWVAAQMPFTTLNSFFAINVIATLFCVLLLFYWFNLFIKNKTISFLMIVYFLLHWFGFLRFSIFYPVYFDSVIFLIILLFLILLNKLNHRFTTINFVLYCLLLFVGVFVREFLIMFIVPLLFIGNSVIIEHKNITINKDILKRNILLFIIALIIGVTATFLTHNLVTVNNALYKKSSFFGAVFELMHAKSVFQFINAWFYVYGVLWIFAIIYFKNTFSFLKNHLYLAVLFIISTGMAWLAGGDTERFIIWFLPISFLLIGLALEKKHKYLSNLFILIPVLLSLIFTLRLPFSIPQYEKGLAIEKFPPIFTMIKNPTYKELFTYYSDRWVSTFILLEYVLLSLWIIGVLFFINRKRILKFKSKA